MTAKTDEQANPGVNFPPPLLFVMSAFGGVGIESAIPLPLSSLITLPAQMILAWSAIVLGTVFLLWAMLTFTIRRIAIYPNQPARELIGHGPYKISRNPMYVALAMIAIGVGLLADNLWMLGLLPLVLITLTQCVIRREEAYLTEAFGESYLAYQARVRRWL